VRVFKTKGLAKFARRARITDAVLREAIERAERGIIDADLAGGLIKQRLARPGEGRSGGYRVIVAYRAMGRAIFLYGFAKNDLGNISPEQLQTLRTIAGNWLAASAATIKQATEAGDLQEIDYDDQTKPNGSRASGNGRSTA
jgi:hypothetical protein